jgi:hypothetical protein
LLEFLHLTHGSSLSFSQNKTVLATWLVSLCIGMLLLSTTAQAIHCCDLNAPSERAALGSPQSSPNSAICLICLMAHSAAAAVLLVMFSPTFRKRDRASVPQVRPRLFLESFQLYVRPPPAI